MEVRFFNFPKRENSTKRPNINPVLTVDALMRNDSSIISPVLELHKTAAINTRLMNYVYIPAYDRFYFVRDWVWQSGLWLIYLDEDYLASWKITIGNTEDYVVRSSHSWNRNIIDNVYPLSGEITIEETPFETPYNRTANNTIWYNYIVSLIGSMNTTTYYAMDSSQYAVFMANLFGDIYAESLYPDFLEHYPELKALSNPIQYVRSVRQFPFDVTDEYVSMEDVKKIPVGWGSIEIPDEQDPSVMIVLGKKLTSKYAEHTITLDVPKHPQMAARGEYLNHAPYTEYELFFPPFGVISLDTDSLVNSEKIELIVRTDFKTGNAILEVWNNPSGSAERKILSWVSAKASIEHTLTQIQAPGFGTAARLEAFTSAASAAMAGFEKGGPVGSFMGSVSSQLQSIGKYVKSKVPTSSTIGSDGGISTFEGACKLQAVFSLVVADDVEQRGRPLCQRAQINTLPGYLVIEDPDFQCAGTAEEITEIKNYMAGGFYYE